MIKGLFGINIAVKDLDAAAKKYSDVFGVKPIPYKSEEIAVPGLKGVRLPIGNVTITLLASDDPNTPVAKFVENRGEGVFLVNLEVTDIENDMKDMAAKGVQILSDKPISAASGKVAYGHPKSMHGVQIELFELAPGWPPER